MCNVYYNCATSPPRAGRTRSYGISTLTLKKRCTEFVGAHSTLSAKLSLPRNVYFRTTPFVLRFGDQVMYGTSFEMASAAASGATGAAMHDIAQHKLDSNAEPFLMDFFTAVAPRYAQLSPETRAGL